MQTHEVTGKMEEDPNKRQLWESMHFKIYNFFQRQDTGSSGSSCLGLVSCCDYSKPGFIQYLKDGSSPKHKVPTQ